MTTEQQASNRPRAKAAFWFIGVVVVASSAWLLSEISQYRLREIGTWPVSQATSDHPIANTFGELVAYRSWDEDSQTIYGPYRKLHEGVDILAIPHGDPFPSEVIVTAEGTISKLEVNPDDNYNEVVILATDGTHQFTYVHLEHPPPATLVAAKNNAATVYPHEVVGTIRKAFPCGYNHLHYGVTQIAGSSEKAINPLKKIFPKPDQIPPDISSIHLARHSLPRWSIFGTVGNRTVVSGGVDIVAAVTDRDDAGSAALAVRNVGLYDVKWRACAIANPNCGWNDTHRNDEMFSSPFPRPWDELFSFSYPWVTTEEEWSDLKAWIWPEGNCPASGSTYMVLRNSARMPSWNTQEQVNGSPKYKDGDYVLSVKALDYANQADIYSVNVCVANLGPASCSLTTSTMGANIN